MAECNCGCGRKIGFGGRGMNKNIRRTDDLVTKLRDGREGFAGVVAGADAETVATADAEPGELLDRLDDLIHDSESYRDFWVEATHGDYPRGPQCRACDETRLERVDPVRTCAGCARRATAEVRGLVGRFRPCRRLPSGAWHRTFLRWMKCSPGTPTRSRGSKIQRGEMMRFSLAWPYARPWSGL